MSIQKLAYTFEEAAEQSGYSAQTLKQAVADGNLIARYVKAEAAIRHEDLRAWISQLPTRPDTSTRAIAPIVGASFKTVARDVEAVSNDTPSPVQGMDGKTYTRPATQPPLSRPESENEWLKPEDLAKTLQIAVGTINNWRGQGKGPDFNRFEGGIVRYHREAVDAWFKAQPKE
jgi:hypothetical protein